MTWPVSLLFTLATDSMLGVAGLPGAEIYRRGKWTSASNFLISNKFDCPKRPCWCARILSTFVYQPCPSGRKGSAKCRSENVILNQLITVLIDLANNTSVPFLSS